MERTFSAVSVADGRATVKDDDDENDADDVVGRVDEGDELPAAAAAADVAGAEKDAEDEPSK